MLIVLKHLFNLQQDKNPHSGAYVLLQPNLRLIKWLYHKSTPSICFCSVDCIKFSFVESNPQSTSYISTNSP